MKLRSYMQYFQEGARGNCLIRLTQYSPLVLAPAPTLKPQVLQRRDKQRKIFAQCKRW